MFCFFLNDQEFGFWGNRLGDIFLMATITNLRLNPSGIDVCYFPELFERPAFYEFNDQKELIIKEEVKEEFEETILDENGVEKIIISEIFIYKEIKTIKPIHYFSKGIMLLPC